MVPIPKDYKSTPALRWFAEGRQKDTPDWGPHPECQEELGKGLQTTSGKIEFVSSSLKRFDPGDEERPLMPKYMRVLGGTSHHRSLQQVSLAADFAPPTVQLPHHGGCQGHLDERRQGPPGAKDDGYYYWIIRINAQGCRKTAASSRTIWSGCSTIAERSFSRPRSRSGCRPERSTPTSPPRIMIPIGKPGESPDRGGCVNILTPSRYITKNSAGMAPNSCLVQIEKYQRGEVKET